MSAEGRLPFEDVAVPGPWRARGACVVVPTEVFFPGRGISLEPAKSVCRICPVLGACLDYAVTEPELKGVWGGLGEEERRQLRAQQVREAATPAPPSPQSRRRPPTARPGNGALYRTLAALSASPGRWARVARYADASSAAATAARLRGGGVDAPAGVWEFAARPDGAGSALFARYRAASTPSTDMAS